MMNPAVAHQTEEVEYEDTNHVYHLRGRIYRSATQIVEKFIEPFNAPVQAARMADRYGQSPEYWIAKWKGINQKALDRGSKIHKEKEDFLHGRGFAQVNDKHFQVYNLNVPLYAAFRTNYSKLPDGIYPELKLWRHDWGIAGRVDKPVLETVAGNRFAHVEDYKTGKKIATESYRDYKTGNYDMMLGALSHLQDCEFNHYALQLSIYQFMLEYFGFKPGTRRLIHYPHKEEWMTNDPSPVIIPVPYLRIEVLAMLHQLKHLAWLR